MLATGLGDAVRRRAGIARAVVSRRHSLSIGFDMAAPRDAFPFEALTYSAEAFGARCADLTLFPVGATVRGNLFVYRDPADAWTKGFCTAPEAALRALLPNLHRPVDPIRAEDPARDGVVLIGDADLDTCPIPGTGIGKVLVDVERLCAVHVPRWLALPAIDRAAVASF